MKVTFYFIFLAVVTFCGGAFVDKLQKCHINDNECMRALCQSIARSIGNTGIPEFNIPRVDPMEVNNITIKIADMLDATLVQGYAEGLKDCVFQKFKINITSESGIQETKCNVTIKGHYRTVAKSPLLVAVLGQNSVRGDGNIRIKIDNLQLKLKFPFYAQKRNDGEIYIKCLYDAVKYTYKIGKMNFLIDNIFVGDKDSSQLITGLLNDNWRFGVSKFGQPFIDTAMKIYFNYAGNFFDAVPARHFIIDDLSVYAKP